MERHDGFVDAFPIDTYFAPYSDWSTTEHKALEYATGSIVDVGCGAGRVALHLQQLGLDVTGIDISPLSVDICRQRGVKNIRLQSFEQMIAGAEPHDTVLLFGNNFGIFRSAARTIRVLRRLTRVTPPHARILAASQDIHASKDDLQLAYFRANRERGRLPGQYRMRLRFRHYRTPWSDYLFVGPGEMEALIRRAGWRLSELIDDDLPLFIGLLQRIDY